jgi:hypothetical protein
MQKGIVERIFLGSLTFSVIAGGISLLIYIPAVIICEVYDGIQNPPSEIYGERQRLDYWSKKCVDEDCYDYTYTLKIKSILYSNLDQDNETESDVVAFLVVDDMYMELSIELKDWNTGETISPYPQPRHSWYEIFKNYETFETIISTVDYDGNYLIDYEALLTNEHVVITEESCDSRGLELQENIKGGCFLLDRLENGEEELESLYVELKGDRTVLIVM